MVGPKMQEFCPRIDMTIVIKHSGHAMLFGPILGENLWQLSRLAEKHKHVNATYLPFILEEIKIP